MEDILISVNQAALLLKVHPLTIRRYIKEGKLKALKAGGNIRIPQSAINSFTNEISPQDYSKKVRQTTSTSLEFSEDDPIFRLKGRGASLKSAF